jgi:hypothetical protein
MSRDRPVFPVPKFEKRRLKARRKEVLNWKCHFFIPYTLKLKTEFGRAYCTNVWYVHDRIEEVKKIFTEKCGRNFYYASNIFSFKSKADAASFRLIWF